MTLFALVPLLMVFYAVFSLVPAFATVGEQLQDALFANLLPESSHSVRDFLSRHVISPCLAWACCL